MIKAPMPAPVISFAKASVPTDITILYLQYPPQHSYAFLKKSNKLQCYLSRKKQVFCIKNSVLRREKQTIVFKRASLNQRLTKYRLIISQKKRSGSYRKKRSGSYRKNRNRSNPPKSIRSPLNDHLRVPLGKL